MKILFVSGELIAGNLAYEMKKEGHDVKLYIGDKERLDCFDNMVNKTNNWQEELEWVGKDGLIVFDDIGYGKVQDELGTNGYTVFGGCEEGDKLEMDREYAQKIFSEYGMDVEKSKDFTDYDEAIDYIKNHKCAWVLKQNTHASSLAYIGMMKNGEDIISIINNYKKYNKSDAVRKISLQKKVNGVEVAIARYFNGKDWTSPVFVSFEHKPFFDKDIGPLTAEMGTLGWYDEDEKNKLFTETLFKIKPYLEKINYRGYVDINSIINKDRLIPLEATMRFGEPTNHLQNEIHLSHWADLLYASAKGEKYILNHKNGYSVVVCIVIPPFPYRMNTDNYLKDVEILFKDKLTEEEWKMINFEEVKFDNETKNYRVAGHEGYILYITGTGDTVESARKKAYHLIKKIVLPKMMYRTDIGLKFIKRDRRLLEKWGWIKK